MLDSNLGTPEQIASVTSLPPEQVLELQKEAKPIKMKFLIKSKMSENICGAIFYSYLYDTSSTIFLFLSASCFFCSFFVRLAILS